LTAAVRRIFDQMPAGCIDKEEPGGFLQAPFPEVLDLVGFTLADRDERQPAAALTATAAGAG